MAVTKPMLTEFGIHYRLESCEVDFYLSPKPTYQFSTWIKYLLLCHHSSTSTAILSTLPHLWPSHFTWEQHVTVLVGPIGERFGTVVALVTGASSPTNRCLDWYLWRDHLRFGWGRGHRGRLIRWRRHFDVHPVGVPAVFDEGASLGEVHVAGRAVFVLRVHHVGPGRVGQAVGGCFGYRYGHYLNLINIY